MTYPRLLRWLPLALAVWLVVPQTGSPVTQHQTGPAPAVQIDISTLALER